MTIAVFFNIPYEKAFSKIFLYNVNIDDIKFVYCGNIVFIENNSIGFNICTIIDKMSTSQFCSTIPWPYCPRYNQYE